MTRLSRSQAHQTISGSPALLLWLCMQSLQHRRSGADEPPVAAARPMPLFEAGEGDAEAVDSDPKVWDNLGVTGRADVDASASALTNTTEVTGHVS